MFQNDDDSLQRKLYKITKAITWKNEENDTSAGIFRMFLHSLIKKKLKASVFYWTHLNNLVANAVVAHHILMKLKKTVQDKKGKEKIEKYLSLYETAANETLRNCEMVNLILMERIMYWNEESCITIAKATKNINFLYHEACRELNDTLWSGRKDEKSDNHSGTRQESNEKVEHRETRDDTDQRSSKSLLTPKKRFIFDLIGYVTFLTSFGLLLISQLKKNELHWLEFVVMFYILILFIRESDQCFWNAGKKCYLFTREYLLDPFNVLDNLALSVSIAAWACRFLVYITPQSTIFMELAHYLLSITFIIYSVRFLEFLYTMKSLGPIVVIIVSMLKIYIPFLLILLVFLLAYSVAAESLLHPEKEMAPSLLYNVFKGGLWAMIGQYDLEDIAKAGTHCTNNRTLFQGNLTTLRLPRCPVSTAKYSVPVMRGLYSIFVQLLLFNLVICLFSNEILKRRDEWDKISNFQRIHQTMQYSTMKFLLPPFLPMIFCLFTKSDDPYCKKLDGLYTQLRDAEHDAAEKTITSFMDKSLLTEKVRSRKKDYKRQLLSSDKKTRKSERLTTYEGNYRGESLYAPDQMPSTNVSVTTAPRISAITDRPPANLSEDDIDEIAHKIVEFLYQNDDDDDDDDDGEEGDDDIENVYEVYEYKQ